MHSQKKLKRINRQVPAGNYYIINMADEWNKVTVYDEYKKIADSSLLDIPTCHDVRIRKSITWEVVD